jgi:hypothetical protein
MMAEYRAGWTLGGAIGDGLHRRFDNFCDEGQVDNILLSEDIPLSLPSCVSISCTSWTRSSTSANTRRGRLVAVVKHNGIRVLSVRVMYSRCSQRLIGAHGIIVGG